MVNTQKSLDEMTLTEAHEIIVQVASVGKFTLQEGEMVKQALFVLRPKTPTVVKEVQTSKK